MLHEDLTVRFELEEFIRITMYFYHLYLAFYLWTFKSNIFDFSLLGIRMDPLSYSMGQKCLFQICQKILSSSGFDDLDMPLIPTEVGQSSDTIVAEKTGPKCHAKILGMTRVSFCS